MNGAVDFEDTNWHSGANRPAQRGERSEAVFLEQELNGTETWTRSRRSGDPGQGLAVAFDVLHGEERDGSGPPWTADPLPPMASAGAGCPVTPGLEDNLSSAEHRRTNGTVLPLVYVDLLRRVDRIRPPFRCRRRGDARGHRGECSLNPRIGEGKIERIWILVIASRPNRVGDALEQKLFVLRIVERCEIDRRERGIEDPQHLVRIGVKPCLSEGRGRLISFQPIKDHPAEKTPARACLETSAEPLRNHSEEVTGGSRSAVRAIGMQHHYPGALS